MRYAGWGDLWNLAVARLATEPVQMRILTGLAIVFIALMILEGLRASFFPPKARRRTHELPPTQQTKSGTGGTKELSGPFRPRSTGAPTPKRLRTPVSRHSAPRPTIHRVPADEPRYTKAFAPTFTEDNAPYSPVTSPRTRV